MDAIQRAHLLKEELDTLRPISRENEMRIMQKFRLDWNYHSNNLEGNSLTYGETKALILFGLTAQGKPFKDHLEMTGHNEAVEWIVELVKEDRPLTQNFIRQLHELLLKETYQVDAITPTGEPTKKWIIVGDYKQTPNHVLTKTGEIFRFATVEETPAKMLDLTDWFQQEKEKQNYNAITTAIEFHYRFTRIHPFDDGNGRTARILMNFILMQSGYPPVIIKTGEKQEYIAALEQADAGLFEPFINYIAQNLCKSLELMIKGAKGRSVEEENDIDKEIALLDFKLQNVGRKFTEVKSEELIQKVFKNTIFKILESFIKAVSGFEKYFQEKTYYYSIKYKQSKEVEFQTIDELLSKLKIAFDFESYDIDDFTFTVKMAGLNYLKLENEDILLGFKVSFNETKYDIISKDFEKELLYTDTFSKEDINQLNRAIKNFGLLQMNAIVEKYQNAP